MKILLTTHQFLPEYTSGTEVLSFEVARELIRFGHQVRILTGWPPSEFVDPPTTYDEYAYEGIHVYRIYPPPFGKTTMAERTRAEFDNPATAAAFTALTATWRPDVVHFFHLQRLSASIPMRCAQQGIACVFTATDFWSICPLNQLRLPSGETCPGPEADSANCVLHLAVQGRRAHLAPLYRWVPKGLVGAMLKIAPQDEQSASSNLSAARALQHRPAVTRRMLDVIDRIIAPTTFMAQRLKDFGAAEESIVELGYGIDTKVYANHRPLLTSDHLRIGFIGTLHEHKGAHVLIDAIKLLDASAACSVSIYGDEKFYPEYVAQLKASAEGESRIMFQGTFKRAELPRVIDTFDILVVPSTWTENTPLVILAAQAAGRPVIGSDVAGIAEAVSDGVNGRLFKGGSSPALAAVLAELIGHPAQLLEMAQQAKPTKDISRYVADLLDIYEEVLAERASNLMSRQRIPA